MSDAVNGVNVADAKLRGLQSAGVPGAPGASQDVEGAKGA